MKKNNALGIIAIIGSALLVIGLIIGIIGLSLGGVFQSWTSWDWFPFRDGNHNWNQLTNYAEFYGSETISSLELTFPVGHLTIAVAEQAGYSIKNYPKDTLQISYEDETLKIHDFENYYSLRSDMYKDTFITIYITQPKLQDLDVTLGVGTFTFEECDIGVLNLQTGVSDCTLRNIKAKSCTINGGVGRLAILECTLNDAVIESGIGELQFDGRLTGYCSVTTGIGNAAIHLQEAEKKYYFTAQSDIGAIRIDGKNISTMFDGETTLGKSDAPNLIQLSSGIGDITVTFD